MKRAHALPAVLFLVSVSFRAPSQQQPVVIEDELTIDDDDPLAIGEIEIHHKQAVVVRTADIDEDGITDVIIGGLNTPGNADLFSTRVHYLYRWGIRHTEVLGDTNGDGSINGGEIDHASHCYDLSIVDVNQDGHKDILVGRHFVGTVTNTVFLRLGTPTAGGNYFGTDPITLKPIPKPDNLNLTGGLVAFDADGDTDMDLVSAGDYGVRFYIGRGDGSYQLADMAAYLTSYLSSGGFRGVQVADITGDGAADIVTLGPGVSPKVLKNTSPGPDIKDRFLSYGPAIAEPAPAPLVSGVLVDDPRDTFTSNCNGGVTPTGSATAGGFHCALFDVDTDGDNDLVTANAFASNCVYLNDGTGKFGNTNTSGNGLFAYEFPAIVPDWTGLSDALDWIYINQHGGALPGGCVGMWTVPSARLKNCTGVVAADANADGLKDVIFSNRADYYESIALVTEEQMLDPTMGLPPIYDFLFMNKSTTASLSFPAVEYLGHANDLTSYGILAQINTPDLNSNPAYIGQDTDRRLDWLEANFSLVDPDGDGFFDNDLYFGHRLTAQDYPVVASGSTVPFKLHVSASRANNGGQWHLLASYAGIANPPTTWSGGPFPVEVPLIQDCLFAYATGAGKKSGTVPNSGAFQIQGSYQPSGCNHAGAIYFCVVIFNGPQALVTNAIRVPIQ